MKIGIVGLPNVGKSILFTALTKKKTLVANYAFATIDPSVGIVEVPDDRLKKLTEISGSVKTIPTTIEFVDVAGLVKGAHKGEGLGNQFLAAIREVDAICHVIRSFTDKNVSHVHGEIDPSHDLEIVTMELAMADLATVEKRLLGTKKALKAGSDKKLEAQLSILEKLSTLLSEGNLLTTHIQTQDEKKLVRELSLLTAKPYFVIRNTDESKFSEEDNNISFACPIVSISAKLEAELRELSDEEALSFMKEMGLKESGLSKVIRTGYELLNLLTFFTSGEKESRAWTIVKGNQAPQAAGKIHTDFEKKFIAAEIADYETFVTCKGWQGLKDAGKLRLEGKDYVVKDGDVCYFKVGR